MIDYPDSIAGRLRLASELLAQGLAVTRWRTLPWWRRLRTAPPALPDWSERHRQAWLADVLNLHAGEMAEQGVLVERDGVELSRG